MSGVQRERAEPERRHECPSCRKPTPHERRLRRGGLEVWVCTVCGLVSLVPVDAGRPGARPRP
ncbi:hypothetical protein [Geochorda subterranea]|uniref:Transcription factor zinc-finger domain-containing protein n=1 Tax=Geochorda subterranea TaxID=3109564 RepID=A0ABZ1BLF5_9FIRM|nr:hypothetical protein [Limnochorda sp. LNt]WRP13348.1 hypothetical protein VLY81_07755 [Limnochorda sp. LNt]